MLTAAPVSLGEPWDTAARIVAWDPDRARELLTTADVEADELALARTSELMARAFAVTAAWELARDSYALAAESWRPHHPTRARALGELVKLLPLAPFAGDREALAAERALAERVLDPSAPPPLLLRATTEIRRALAPRRITGLIEAAFELAPAEHALVMAVAALDDAPRLLAHDWLHHLLPSLWFVAPVDRAFELDLLHATPELVAHPRLVSRLGGRTAIEMPRGVRFEETEPGSLRRFRLYPIGQAIPEVMAEAAFEICVHGGAIAVDGVSSPR